MHQTNHIAVQTSALSHHYPDGTAALREVSLVVRHGERVALLGPNGAGKSTLIGHLNGITSAQSGEVSIEGITISPTTVASVRTKVGVVFQDPDNMLFMTTIGEDIAFGPRNMGLAEEEVVQRVSAALAAVGLDDVARKPGLHLSFGQKKRAALASVLAMGPSVLVLDEPTSNLDPHAKRQMVELLAGLHATIIVATHDMDLAWTMCDRAVVLNGGRVVADGPARQIMTDEHLMLSNGLEIPHLALHELAGAPAPHHHHDGEPGHSHDGRGGHSHDGHDHGTAHGHDVAAVSELEALVAATAASATAAANAIAAMPHAHHTHEDGTEHAH